MEKFRMLSIIPFCDSLDSVPVYMKIAEYDDGWKLYLQHNIDDGRQLTKEFIIETDVGESLYKTLGAYVKSRDAQLDYNVTINQVMTKISMSYDFQKTTIKICRNDTIDFERKGVYDVTCKYVTDLVKITISKFPLLARIKIYADNSRYTILMKEILDESQLVY